MPANKSGKNSTRESRSSQSAAVDAADDPNLPPGSMHDRIRRDIEAKIFSGQWQPGHRIPAEDALAALYKCSRMTINKVLTMLAKVDLIVRRPKVGTFVAMHRSHTAILEIRDVSVEVADLALSYSFTLLSRRKRRVLKADKPRLDLPPASQILEIQCCHFAGPRPFCLEHRIISLAAVPDAEHETFLAMAPGPWLVSKVPWSEAEQSIEAISAKDDMAETLRVPANTPCLMIERKTWLADKFVTWVLFTYPGDAHRLFAKFAPTTGSS